ncbi:hypothetical protein DXG01_005136 [Tephrocybe rancida]|nr:hypothetical protein DXG01_005136 [Tephrocybe rancida]
MFPTLAVLSKQSASSTAWLARQYRDPYIKQRLTDPRAYRSRSAFKLLEIDSQWDFFLSKPDVNAIVDLGAAPGGWSQVVAAKLGWDPGPLQVPKYKVPRPTYDPATRWSGEIQSYDPLNIDNEPIDSDVQGRGTIVAVDLLRMQPIHGVHSIQADFLSPEADLLINGLLSVKGNPEGKVDIVLSDMAANMSGNHQADTERSHEICLAVMKFAIRHLRTCDEIGRRRGGVLLLKHFQDPLLNKFRLRRLTPYFNEVNIVKPKASRPDSRETYFICMGWKGIEQVHDARNAVNSYRFRTQSSKT